MSSDKSRAANSSAPIPRGDPTSTTRVRPTSISSGNASTPGAVVEEVTGGVDVGPRVRAHVQRRHVRTVAAGDPLDGLQPERRVPRIAWKIGVERHRDVDELHGLADRMDSRNDSTPLFRRPGAKRPYPQRFDLAPSCIYDLDVLDSSCIRYLRRFAFMALRCRAIGVCVVVTLAFSGGVFAQAPKDKKVAEALKKEAQSIGKVVDGVAAGQPAPNDLSLTWVREDVLKAQNNSEYVPFVVTIDSSKVTTPNAVIYWRVVPQASESPATDKPTRRRPMLRPSPRTRTSRTRLSLPARPRCASADRSPSPPAPTMSTCSRRRRLRGRRTRTRPRRRCRSSSAWSPCRISGTTN